MIRKLFVLFLPLAFAACAVHPRQPFDVSMVPAVPNYALLDNWAAHPDKQDPADRTPASTLSNEEARSQVDVFFLHPTTYTGSKRYERNWNADARDAKLNSKTDSSTILFQASAFNGAGRIFAPRYRQAHLHVFFSKDKKSSEEALDTAYADVVNAFKYYLEHYNNGRPFIIAGHSQGARHAMFLLRDMIAPTKLKNQLVAAYIMGWPVPKDFFKSLSPCESPTETGCFCTWRTWERHYGQRKAFETNVVCTNPLLWTTEEGKYAPKEQNNGSVIRPFTKVQPAIADAEVYKGILLCTKPKFRGSVLFVRKNYHIGDVNLYYMNVRENAQERTSAFIRK